ncbi:DUF6452 family protein [Spirosoma soli]|uniref:DUF6452 family protein n=1 Tax=Spirosoma soli TaxID=1770529 RepID=A0ABW5M3Z6_9BACT
MYRSWFIHLLAALSLLSLYSCENCGPSAEPSLILSFQTNTRQKIDTLYAIGSQKPVPAQPYSTTALTTGTQLALPLNLNADSTRYVFRIDGQRDTVTVFYERRFAYRNRKCGYVLDLYQPKGKSARTTRGTIPYVSYLQNRDGAFLSSSQNTQVQLSVRL